MALAVIWVKVVINRVVAASHSTGKFLVRGAKASINYVHDNAAAFPATFVSCAQRQGSLIHSIKAPRRINLLRTRVNRDFGVYLYRQHSRVICKILGISCC